MLKGVVVSTMTFIDLPPNEGDTAVKNFKRILIILALTLLLSGCTDSGDVILATSVPASQTTDPAKAQTTQTPEPAPVHRPELTPTPEPQATPTLAPSDADETVWKKLYLEFLETELPKQLDKEDSIWRTRWNFGLIYLDDDDVPELVASSQSQMRGSFVCTVRGDELFSTRINGPRFYFRARGNVLVDGNGYAADNNANVFKITDDGFVLTQKEAPETVIRSYDRTYWENGATYEEMTNSLRQVWAEYFTTAFERYLTSLPLQGTVLDDYQFALIGPEKGFPMLLCTGKNAFYLCDFTDLVHIPNLLLPGQRHFFGEGETWTVYPDLRMLEHRIDTGDGDLYVMDYWTDSTDAILMTQRNIDCLQDENGVPRLEDDGNPIYSYMLNGCWVSLAIFNDFEHKYVNERKFQITPWDAPDNTITYYTADQMLEILHKLGEMVPEEVWTKGVDACLQEMSE